jgi:hypothetical protein
VESMRSLFKEIQYYIIRAGTDASVCPGSRIWRLSSAIPLSLNFDFPSIVVIKAHFAFTGDLHQGF